jgi:hypothetical protein
MVYKPTSITWGEAPCVGLKWAAQIGGPQVMGIWIPIHGAMTIPQYGDVPSGNLT